MATLNETETRTVLTCRPRYEGANIRTWIGFKHFMLLAEEAVLQWFRERGLGPQRLYHEFGLGLEVVDASVQLPALLEVDDEVRAEVVELAPGRFTVTFEASRAGARVLVMRGRLAVALVRERDGPAPPDRVAPLVATDVAGARTVAEAGDVPIGPGQDVRSLLTPGAGGLLWSWRAPYFACHFSDRVQHSAYVRALEEVVDRFLFDRGLSIREMLVRRGWIPVVSRARVQLVADAHMEETVHTLFTVTEVLRRTAYDARMDCFVERAGRLVRCATARILHGYALSRGEGAGRLVELDEGTIAALTGPGAAGRA
jgi:acyl-CoA thioesterase FadM